MDIQEAQEWLEGRRDMGNFITYDINPRSQQDDGTYRVRVEQANAAKMEQAYWVLRSHKENLI
jgi:hypothetical protein